jgi:hypothetical protein
MLVIVCAWCERYMGLREAERPVAVSHGICRACMARRKWNEPPTLVVCRMRADLQPVFQEMLRGTPEIRVVVDRRQRERRREAEPGEAERRRCPRRRATPTVVC